MTDELLPALPEPDFGLSLFRDGKCIAHAYTADQLRAYAREAIRLAQGEPIAWAICGAGGYLLDVHESESEARNSIADYFDEVTIRPLYLSPSPPAGEVA